MKKESNQKTNTDKNEQNINPSKQLGIRVRELRQARNLTIRALASQSGISANALSMIENGQTSPTISTVQQIANGLNIQLVEFFKLEKNEKHIIYVRHTDRPKLELKSAILENLGENLAGKPISVMVVTLRPCLSSGRAPLVHSGLEFAYCLNGKILCVVDTVSYLLEVGDSIVFESRFPHQWQNVSSDISQFIHVLIPSCPQDSSIHDHFEAPCIKT